MTTPRKYNLLQRLMHWLLAIGVFGLFGLGYWMVDLTYYSQWYQQAPHWHQSFGFLLVVCWMIRFLINRVVGKPAALSTHSKLEIMAARLIHNTFYFLILLLFVSGYLISTEDGRPIEVFNWFALPSMGRLFARQADIAGTIHQYTAYILIALALVHLLGALKHHYIDKDTTLNRMLGREEQA